MKTHKANFHKIEDFAYADMRLKVCDPFLLTSQISYESVKMLYVASSRLFTIGAKKAFFHWVGLQ